MHPVTRRLLVIALAAGTGIGFATGVAAADDHGKTTGPVQFWAEGNSNCSVDFTIVNATNSTGYEIDFRIDNEVATGEDFGTGPTGRRAGLNSEAEAPIFPEGGYTTKRAPVTANYNVKLGTLDMLPTLPDPLADNHTVHYRMILGPEGSDRGNGDWYHTQISGCNPIVSGSAGLF
ncbi:hypothetical protein [Rhodococcus chondri]|uniref:Uncharacterized protein n=1 Tax=Rhodococcus chondri TaxID=3065941 RepID=A0ABU7JWD1_9NOCA|nr:hypothetical protein [Rhodococcus sp. CC-R104]MEE2034165.1 hypothetical protein [Rhodococcus sp. CC-R104]